MAGERHGHGMPCVNLPLQQQQHATRLAFPWWFSIAASQGSKLLLCVCVCVRVRALLWCVNIFSAVKCAVRHFLDVSEVSQTRRGFSRVH
jgi:hypothetical protein